MEEFLELQHKLDELTCAYEEISKKLEDKELELANKHVITGRGPGGSDQDNPFGQSSMVMKLVAFLNARHYMVFAGKKGQTHGHSWQFQADVSVANNDDSFIKFENLDKNLNNILIPYQRAILNDVSPFDQIEPLTENLAVYFFNVLYDELVALNVHLNKLTVWENPTKGIEITRKTDQFFSTSDSQPIFSAGNITLHKAPDEAAAASDNSDPFSAYNKGSLSDESGPFGLSKLSSNFKATDSQTEDIEKPPDGHDASPKQEILSGVADRRSRDSSLQETAVISGNNNPWWQILLAALIIVGVSVAAYWPILTAPPSHAYPWGADSWGHLYRAEYLFKQMLRGNYFPQFTPDWYNGTQLFRYWAPLPYYCLAGLRWLTSNIFIAGNYYVFLCALIGGLFWLKGRKYLGLWPACLAGMVWVIWPDNLKIAFAEGNLPRILTTALLPLAFWCFFKLLEPNNERKYWPIISIIICVNLLVFSHAMMTAIYCICFMLFAIVWWILGGTSLKHVVRGFSSLILGLTVSAWWLLPSLKGGLTGMSREAAGAPVQFAGAASAFNPLLRFTDPRVHYWGICLLVIIALTLLFWQHKKGWAKSLFFCGLLFMLLTFPSFAWLQKLMPLNYILWPLRFSTFTSFALIACAFAFDKPAMPLFKSGKVKTVVVVLIVFLVIIADSCFSWTVLAKTVQEPPVTVRCASQLQQSHAWRVATLGFDFFDFFQSSPSYLFSMSAHREQIFGWAWQGATTSQNIMLIDTAFERSYYPFLFRELNHLGGTTLVVCDELVKYPDIFQRLAGQYGYSKQKQLDNLSVWEKAIRPYMFIPRKKCLVIGAHASIYAMLFPETEIGRSNFIDEYGSDELDSYESIILSGANWYNQAKAEKMILDYAHHGGRVVVDFTGFPLDVLARQPKFLGVYGEPVNIERQMTLISSDKTIELQPFARDFTSWRAYIPQGLDKTQVSYTHYGNQAAIWGYKDINGDKIWFMGANLAYHALLTSDQNAVKMLTKFTGLSQKYIPEQNIIFDSYQATSSGYKIIYSLDESRDVVIPIADLDGFVVKIDGTVVVHSRAESLISLTLPSGHHIIDLNLISPAVYKQGMLITIMGLASGIIWLLFMYRRDRKRLNMGMVF